MRSTCPDAGVRRKGVRSGLFNLTFQQGQRLAPTAEYIHNSSALLEQKTTIV
jgi:hypothetical protein